MMTQKQEGDPELIQSNRNVDYTQGHIAMLLAAQTNDQERYALAQRIKNNERK
jgi:hypothetical protein